MEHLKCEAHSRMELCMTRREHLLVTRLLITLLLRSLHEFIALGFTVLVAENLLQSLRGIVDSVVVDQPSRALGQPVDECE